VCSGTPHVPGQRHSLQLLADAAWWLVAGWRRGAGALRHSTCRRRSVCELTGSTSTARSTSSQPPCAACLPMTTQPLSSCLPMAANRSTCRLPVDNERDSRRDRESASQTVTEQSEPGDWDTRARRLRFPLDGHWRWRCLARRFCRCSSSRSSRRRRARSSRRGSTTLLPTVRGVMAQTVKTEPRMGASILRLFFHDCFVNVRGQAILSTVARSIRHQC
jgi:hypothetical protein